MFNITNKVYNKKQILKNFKNNIQNHILKTLFEKKNINKKESNYLIFFFKNSILGFKLYDVKKRLIVNLIFRDMIHNYKIWRHIRGYPVNGQRTWSNGKSVTKNNLLLKNFRIKQIIIAYGKKRKNKAAQLIQGEYINKLWLKTWVSEWTQARKYNLKSSRKRGKNNTIFIDLKNLALGITGGYKRKGKARRFNKAKNKFKGITIGLPLFFTRHLYSKVKNKKFLVDFSLLHEQRKMKSKKKIKKKIVTKKKKKK